MRMIKPTVFALCTGVTLGLFGAQMPAAFADTEAQTQRADLPVEELRAFSEVYARIKRDYVEEVDDKTLLEYAVRGMLTGLDPHSNYLNTAQYDDLRASTQGEFGGLGIEIGEENGYVKVIAPIDDTPAQQAGVQSGDLIIRLDGRPIKGMSLTDAVKLMRGEPGTDISLTILRQGQKQPLTLKLTRAVVQVRSVKSRMLEPGLGYVRISQFQSRTADDVVAAVNQLKEQAGGRLNGLVLDLRNNPGGLVTGAVGVSDAFLRDGKIVYTDGRSQRGSNAWHATPDDIIDDAPMVVLVNEGSASASEIVAGALQDHKRAIIVGTQTFGKGSVQTILPLRDGGAVKLTTSRYFTPSGRSIQAAGITPDVPLAALKLTAMEETGARVKEADLEGHLSNPNEIAVHAAATSTVGTDDYFLSEAVNVLKGLAIIAARDRG